MTAAGRRIEVSGEVQGVGFRPWVWRLAAEEGIAGQVRNDASGVTIEAFGDERALDTFTTRLSAQAPRAARVRRLVWSPIPHQPRAAFAIVASAVGEEPRVSIPPDLATCDDCRREIEDPSDRRHGYPFTNCTNCGPRFTMSLAIPYDRPATTMAPFAMCERCQREYDDPADRRFHAQPNACPRCGPRLELRTAAGEPIASDDPLRDAALALAAGAIVAIKGLGGFHLACDAGREAAVAELRQRKGRDEKPFAVMVRDLAAARRLAEISDEEAALLDGIERPIVLLRRRVDAALAPAVAPRNPLLGLLLPYTPLHHLLLEAAGRPLVMTSGNRADEPIAAGNDEALERLGDLADLFLLHDREIASRCDDSVARVVAGGPLLLRRSRGYVPRPVVLARAVERPVLACGAQLKNTFCLAVGEHAYLGPHIGDLDSVSSLEWFEEAVERMERFLGVEPEVIAHDLHPDYLSTRYALAREAAARVGVQHHHAHVAAVLAEHGIEGPVLGVACDGTGFGTDGTAWGGELLRGDASGFERLATLRPIALAGGDRAIREPWRLALALLDDAFDGAPPLERLALFRGRDRERSRIVRAMIARGVNAPLAHGVGRYFDAVGALVLERPWSRYEGQVAMELEPPRRGRRESPARRAQ